MPDGCYNDKKGSPIALCRIGKKESAAINIYDCGALLYLVSLCLLQPETDKFVCLTTVPFD
jgi:hypothetical protein